MHCVCVCVCEDSVEGKSPLEGRGGGKEVHCVWEWERKCIGGREGDSDSVVASAATEQRPVVWERGGDGGMVCIVGTGLCQ